MPAMGDAKEAGMFARRYVCPWMAGAAIVLAGCATGPEPGQPTGLKDASAPRWALKGVEDEMVMAVSPARRTMQLAGSSGALIGAGVAAVANDRYRRAMDEVLEGYDAGALFAERLTGRLTAAVPGPMSAVPPLTSTAGFHSKQQAEQARYASLSKHGADVLLDLRMTYGLFGAAGTLVAKLDGRLVLLPKGRELWDNTIVVYADPILADQRLTDPTRQMGPSFSGLRLTAKQDAIERWTRDGGTHFRKCFEEVVDAAVSALLCDLGLAQEAPGEYYLGKLAMNRKEFAQADAHFRKAIELAPEWRDAQNGRIVNLAHGGKLDEAVEAARQLTESAPDYAPGWFNVAWWLALEKQDPGAAKPYYEKAVELGLPPHEKLDRALAGAAAAPK